jgi:hypothetical protein
MLLRLLECCFYVVCVAMLPEADSPRSEKRERERKRREGKESLVLRKIYSVRLLLLVASIGAARPGPI